METDELESGLLFPMTIEESYPATQLLDHEKPFVVRDSRFLKRYTINSPLGYALLLGSSQFDATTEPLLCVKTDLVIMETVLKDTGWHVKAPYGPSTSWENYTDAMEELREKSDLRSYSCFMFYFSGHGTPEGILLQPQTLAPFKGVIDVIQGIKSLEGKPKILIFDCCRQDSTTHSAGFNEVGGNPNVLKLGEHFTETHNDMIVCFACSHNTKSLSAVNHGSLFTMHLVTALSRFSHDLSFVEILDQAKGGTLHIARQLFHSNQQPVSYSGLNAQLLLKETALDDSDASRVKYVESPVILVPLQEIESKGMMRGSPTTHGNSHMSHRKPVPLNHSPTPPPQLKPGATSWNPPPKPLSLIEPVMKDHVLTPRTYSTKEEVIENASSLGKGHNVFLCYLPDPGSPFGDPNPVRLEANEYLISLLQYDLTVHGFSVTSDLNLGDQRPQSLLQWYVSHIHRCHHVVLVCSPAFCELFTAYQPQGEVKDERARRFLHYSSAIYAECESDVATPGGGMGKFIPVILDPQWDVLQKSVPLLFRSAQIYRLFETDCCKRKFDYHNTERDFEHLVCRMVGIDRAQLNAAKPGAVFEMTKPASLSGDAERGWLLSNASRPRKGFKTIPFSAVATGQSARKGFKTVPRSAVATGHSAYQPAVQLPSPQHHHTAQSAYQPAVQPPPQHHHTAQSAYQPAVQPPPQHYHTATPMDPAPSQQPLIGGNYVGTPSQPPIHYPASSHIPPQSHIPATGTHHQRLPDNPAHYYGYQPPAPTFNTHPHPGVPLPSPATQVNPPPSSQTPAPDTSSLPTTAPPQRVLLWLSNHLVKWRFFARYLGVEDHIIDRIEAENQGDIREQCYQMLSTSKQQNPDSFTCRNIGLALLESENNRKLLGEYCNQVLNQ